jgi:hypothetical protein
MAQPRRIILVEDDPGQAEFIAKEVIWLFEPEADVKYFDSEYSLLEAISHNELQDWGPQYAIFDLLVRYYSPQDLADMSSDPNLDDLPDAKKAGVRCRDVILNEFPSTKVAIVTVLDTVPEGCLVIQKGSDVLAEQLVDFLRS